LADIKEAQFDNLDSWVPEQIGNKYEKDVLSKLISKKKKEEAKDQRPQQQYDPFPIGGAFPRGGPQPAPAGRPHIIGDPYI
jgi:hypothetical protein